MEQSMNRRSRANRPAMAINRKWMLALAIALLAAALALLVSTNRPQPTIEYLVAKRDLPTGITLDGSAFTTMPLALGAAGKNYLAQLPTGATLRTALRAGDILAVDSLGQSNQRFSVVLSPSQPLSSRVRVGSRIDVWFVAKAGQLTAVAAPIRVATDLEVRSIVKFDAGLSSALNAGLSKLEVAANEADLPALMSASADAGFISVVSSD
jgi:uncharacterized integral membrane protein